MKVDDECCVLLRLKILLFTITDRILYGVVNTTLPPVLMIRRIP